MDAGLEGERRDGGGEYVHQAEGRMIGYQMAAALRAIFAFAERSLLEGRDVLGARSDLHCLRLPEAEGVHRPARPRPARTAVAIAHAFGFAAHFKFDRAAKAFAFVNHPVLSLVRAALPPTRA